MTTQNDGLIDQILSITPGSRLDTLRRHREASRQNIQKAHVALFEPIDASQVSLLERFAIASFVSALQGQIILADYYAHRLSLIDGGLGVAAVINSQAEAAATAGPYGVYPAGPLAAENKIGPHYSVDANARRFLGQRLAAALDHAHLLVFRPRDSSRAALETLSHAGWSTAGIVTLSQLVAYLAFQARIVEGLSALAASSQPVAANTVTPFAEARTARAHS